MKVQFLYHPENDQHIALKIIEVSGMTQSYPLDALKIKEIGTTNDELYDAIMDSDVLILLIGTTFKKITPIIWINALQNKKAIFGIKIHSIPDEWGETKKKGAKWNTEAFQDGESIGELVETYDLPGENNGIEFIEKNIRAWCESAINHAKSNYGIT